MEPMYCIALDVHQRKNSYCVKDSGGKVFAEGSPPANQEGQKWAKCMRSKERGRASALRL